MSQINCNTVKIFILLFSIWWFCTSVHAQIPSQLFTPDSFALPSCCNAEGWRLSDDQFFLISANYSGAIKNVRGITVFRWLNDLQAIVAVNDRFSGWPPGIKAKATGPGWKLPPEMLEKARKPDYNKSVLADIRDPGKLKADMPGQLQLKCRSTAFPKLFAFTGLTLSEWQWLLWHPEVTYLQDNSRRGIEELSLSGVDLAANGALLSHLKWPDLKGYGSTVSIKERQFDTLDIDWDKRSFTTRYSDKRISDHASIMATLVAGAANSSHRGLGVAPGATLTGNSFDTLLPEPPAYYQQYGITIQNHSYGVGVESFYGTDGAAYDQSTWSDTTLLHIFSAGNAGTEKPTSGIYKDLQGWANLTGSFKMSKNSVAVAAHDSFNLPELRSSRGPAFDGRIKPELAAFGEDGSSGAAAITTGAAALLQQRLRENLGHAAPASLVKALIINGTKDTGPPGPDFVTGYGILDISASAYMAGQQQYQTASLAAGGHWQYALQVPPNASLFSITLCWTDTAGSPGSFKALMNDLDITITTPAGQTILPWALNSFPHRDSLLKPAYRGRDSLNNTERITLTDPLPGTYRVHVMAHALQTTRQSFAVAWSFPLQDVFEFTTPTRHRPVALGEGLMIRWQTSLQAGTKGTLMFENLDDQSSVTIAENIPTEQQYFLWKPNFAKGAAGRLAMQAGAKQYVSDTFILNSLPQPKVGFLCKDSLLMYWPEVAGASAYQLLALRDGELQAAQILSDTQIIVSVNTIPDKWVALQPLLGNKQGYRSLSFDPALQGVGCYISGFLADYVDGTAMLQVSLGTIYGLQTVFLEKWKDGRFQTLQSFPVSGSMTYNYEDRNLVTGANIYRVRLLLANGQNILSPAETVYYTGNEYFVLYPNPALRDGTATLISRYEKNSEAVLIDMTGRPMRRFLCKDLLNPINLYGLSAGMYLLVMSDGGKKLTTMKLVIQ